VDSIEVLEIGAAVVDCVLLSPFPNSSKHLLTIPKASLRSFGLPKMHRVCVAKDSSNKLKPHPSITRLVSLYHAAAERQPFCGDWKKAAPACSSDWTKLLPGKSCSMSRALMIQLLGIMWIKPAPPSAGWNNVEK
jgi:hypothetical protein